MANERKYQVFISSTYEDLKEERVYAMNAVLQEGHIPIGMELFHASDETQWELIKRRIEESDYYILIIAKAYGSMDGEISYTEKEYDYAVSINVPVIRFVIDKSVNDWNNDFIDSGVKKRRLDKFIKKATTNRQTAYWKNKDDLNSKIKSALRDLIQIKPRRGWVRADETDYRNVAEELARLSKENEELKQEISKYSSDEGIINELLSKAVKIRYGHKYQSIYESTLASFLVDIFDWILIPRSTYDISREVGRILLQDERLIFNVDDVKEILLDLMLLKLVEPQLYAVQAEGWVFTKLGRDVATKLRRSNI